MTVHRTYFTQLYVVPLNRKSLAETLPERTKKPMCVLNSIHLAFRSKGSIPVSLELQNLCLHRCSENFQ